MLKHSLIIIVLLMSFDVNSQDISNISAQQVGKKIIITYDLVGERASRTFSISLFVNEDQGNNWCGPLKSVTGDVGKDINAGNSKQIVWDVLSEPDRTKLQGDHIKFKITAEYSKFNCGFDYFTDPRDNEEYPTIQIGKQCWMKKNLNFKTEDSKCYQDETDKCNTYGRLYNEIEANSACPQGWHLPSDYDWFLLVGYLGGDEVAGGKMKETGSSHWFLNKIIKTTNSSGFTGLPAGSCFHGDFFGLNNFAYFWSSTQSGDNTVWIWSLDSAGEYLSHNKYNSGSRYFSVRCIRN
jgi:uncharacterized protein (TIGR02145 family)